MIIRLLTCPAIALDIDSVYWVTWIVSDKHNTEHTLPSHPNMGRKKAQHGSAKNQKENVPKTTTLQDKLSSLNDRLLACKYFNVEQLCIWISPEELTLLDRNEMRSVTIRWRVLWLWVWVSPWMIDGWLTFWVSPHGSCKILPRACYRQIARGFTSGQVEDLLSV